MLIGCIFAVVACFSLTYIRDKWIYFYIYFHFGYVLLPFTDADGPWKASP